MLAKLKLEKELLELNTIFNNVRPTPWSSQELLSVLILNELKEIKKCLMKN